VETLEILLFIGDLEGLSQESGFPYFPEKCRKNRQMFTHLFTHLFTHFREWVNKLTN